MLQIALALIASLIAAPAWCQGTKPLSSTPLGVLTDVPSEVAAAAAAYLDECRSYGSSPSPTDKFIVQVELSGDGVPDYLIDTDEINASCFCGSGGCTIEVWVSERGRHVQAFESNVREWRISTQDNLLTVDLHGTACGGVGADICLKELAYRDGKMVETKVRQ